MTGQYGTGWPNLTYEAKLEGTNGDSKNSIFFCSADYENDQQPYQVDTQSAESYNNTYTLSAQGAIVQTPFTNSIQGPSNLITLNHMITCVCVCASGIRDDLR